MQTVHGLWFTHRAYRWTHKSSLALDLVRDILHPFMYYAFYKITPKEIVAQCAYRYMRLHKLTAISDWNRLVEVIAERVSGNPIITAKALTIAYRWDRQHRPVVFNTNDDGSFRMVSPKYRCYGSERRLKEYIINAGLRKRQAEIKKQSTCSMCGRYDAKGPRVTGVYTRYVNVRSRRSVDQIFDRESTPLCISCWNRVRPLVKAANEINEFRLHIDRTIREFSSVSKKHHQQNSSSLI